MSKVLSFPYLTLSIWRCCKFCVIEATSFQEDRRVLERSSSDISELGLRSNQDKQVSITIVKNKTTLDKEFLTSNNTNLVQNLKQKQKGQHVLD